MHFGKFSAIVLAAATAIATVTAAAADEIEEFFTGKTINIIVPAGPSSGYDIYARIMAEHFSTHMPGSPTVIVQNMPGAGGAKAARYYATVAKSDGTELLLAPQTIGTDSALGLLGDTVDVAAMNWIGRFTANVPVGIVARSSGVTSASDLTEKEVVFGGTSARSPTIVYPKAMNTFAGANLKIVSGFDDTRQTFLSMMQGETDGLVSGWAGLKVNNKDMLDAGELIVLFQGATERHPDLPDVPTIVDLAQGDANKAATSFLASSAGIGRSIVAHPDVPQARIDALRAAFVAMINDPDFLAAAEERNMELTNVSGHEPLDTIISDTLAVDEAVLDTVREALGL